MTNSTTFYIVRHGESEGNVKRILQGQSDYKLTAEGEQQARKRAQDLKRVPFDAAFSSDLLRAKRTAEIIALEHQLTVTTSKALRERHYGRFQGMSRNDFTEDIHQIFEQWNELADHEWMNHRIDENFETGAEMMARFILFIREIAVGYLGKNVLMVSHGDLMKNFLIHVGWGTTKELSYYAISNTAYFVLESDGTDFFVRETEGIRKEA